MMRRAAGGERRETRVADRLHSAAIHLLRHLRKQDEASGLSGARLSALSVIVFAGPVTLGQLADAEQVRPPTMTRIVSGLEMQGLAARAIDPDDRRIVRVQATAKGRQVMRAGRRRRVSYLAARLRRLPGREIDLLGRACDLLERLARHE